MNMVAMESFNSPNPSLDSQLSLTYSARADFWSRYTSILDSFVAQVAGPTGLMKREEEAIVIFLALKAAVVGTFVGGEMTEFVAVDADRAVETGA